MAIDVSVVIATWRRPTLVLESIRAALAQDGVAVEVIVVDDDPAGSAEASVRGLGDARVTYLKRAVHSGGLPGLVYNDGWPMAQGRYVAFLDDDDLPQQDAYRELAAALDAHPDRASAFGRVEPFGGRPEEMLHETAFFIDASQRAKAAARAGSRQRMLATLLFSSAVFVTSACMIRRDRLAELAGFHPELRMAGSTELHLRAVRRWGFVFVDRVVVRYRVQADSLTHNEKNRADWVRSYEQMYDRYRREHGRLEMLRLKLFARTML